MAGRHKGQRGVLPRRPQAVIFDMDGVLFDTERLARQCWQRVFADYGYELPDALYRQAIGRTIKATLKLFGDAFDNAIPIAEMDEKQEAIYQDYISRPLPLKPGVHELLDYLGEADIPCALGSSTYHAQVEQILSTNRLLARFSVVVGGDDVRQGKPAPDIFVAAAAGLGVAPERCLVIEDSENGLRAANNAKAITVMVPDLIPAADIDPALDFVVAGSLSKLIGQL